MMLRHRPRHAERGASLIIVLIVVTVVSVVLGAVLTTADTNERATVALRDQASMNFGADGATEAVLNALQHSTLNCSDPTTAAELTLGTKTTPFYQPVSSQQGGLDAYARCTTDAINGASTTVTTPPPVTTTSTVTATSTSTSASLGGGDPTLPSYALLATGSGSGDYGIDFSTSASQKTACIENGSVASNKDIDILKPGSPPSGQYLAVRLNPSLTGVGTSTCTTGTGVDPTTGSRLLVQAAGNCLAAAPSYFTPTPCTPHAAPISYPPAPPLPSPISATNPAPVCTTVSNVTYAAYMPGLYTNAGVLNTPSSPTCTGIASTVVQWLSPGAYYFNFSGPAGTQWNWPKTLIAGTPTDGSGQPLSGLDPTKASTLGALANAGTAPKACQDAATTQATVKGAELIFGGASTAATTGSGSSATTAEICASSPTDSPPVALYGLANAATVPLAGGGSVTIPAETLCSATGCGSTSLVQTGSSGQAVIYFKGYIYAPNAQLDLTMKNTTGQVFNWGVVVRDFRFFLNGVSPTDPFLQLPKPNTAVGVVTTTSTSTYATTSTSYPAPSTSTAYTIRYINVWVCPAAKLASDADKCPSDGTPNVQVQVLTDSSGQPVKVLSWSQIR